VASPLRTRGVVVISAIPPDANAKLAVRSEISVIIVTKYAHKNIETIKTIVLKNEIINVFVNPSNIAL
jgi:hypothetical protein